MNTRTDPDSKVSLLIRVPVDKVFEAFVDPDITTKFWFTHSDGRLEQGKDVNWEWRMFGVSAPVHVVELEPNQHIQIDWGDGEHKSSVEWTFESRDDGTVVTVSSYGFSGNREEVVAKAIDSQGGFALVLSNAKALLEHDIDLNLIYDSHPELH